MVGFFGIVPLKEMWMSGVNESIVLVGGGGGVYRVARSLKHIRPNITTIQTVFDHGSHSGQLRDERGVLPPGDIRQGILALSDDQMEPTLRELMSYRFAKKGSSCLNNATVGNILLTALTEIEGSLPAAIRSLSRLCGVKGKVLPVSLDNAELCVKLSDGSVLEGEGNIDTRPYDSNASIQLVYLKPKAHIFVDAYEALIAADKIVFCPGDLYTSLVPNLLVDGFAEALRRSNAKLIYCANLMNKKAETHGFCVADFVRVVHHYIGRKIDFVVYNSEPISERLKDLYATGGSYPVCYQVDFQKYARGSVAGDLIDSTGDVIRHNERIASIIADCC